MSSSSTPRKRSHSDVDDELPTFDDPADLVNAVILTLQRPEEHTNVAETFANDKNLATEIQAYAKIAGCDWTFYVKSLAISIGRNTDNNNNTVAASQNGKTSVDIDLGPAKVVSRQHATITYNLDLRCWELQVLGRNGARIDGQKVPVGPNHSTPLHSGAILDVGGTQMMFILPDSPPNILQKILTKCLTKYKEMKKKYNGSVNSYPAPSNQIRSFQMFDKAQLIQSPSSVSATSLQNNLDQDLSKEEAKDIKPPYSYATMITQAILSNEDGVMSLSEIYNWIGSHYAYYKYSKTGWQNSIRHNLSLNKAFEKVPRRPNEPGKGMKWQISESYKEDFMSKIENGSLLKNRRGSSVSRQLHLHLATHKHLPESQKNYQKENSIELQLHHNQQKQLQQHQQEHQGLHQGLHQQPFQPQFTHLRTNSLPKLEHSYPINNPLSYMSNQNGFAAQRPPYQPNFQPNLMYGAPLINQPVHLNQHNGIGLVKSELSSPTRQLNDINTTTPKLPKVGGSHLFNLPPPPPHTLGAAHSRLNSYNPPEMNYNSNTTEENHQSASTTNNTNPNSTANTTTATASDLALGFASPKKIAPLEAFTPERGSKSVNVKLGVNGVNTNQSSPAFWNFVQFSTPNGQTPMRKNSDENSQGSPTTSRKRPDIYDKDEDKLSPLKKNETEKA